MAYRDKVQDHQKRRDQEGSYSLYNYLYHWLLDNCEPDNVDNSIVNLLLNEGYAYCVKGGKPADYEYIKKQAKKAVDNFRSNNGKHGDTADNFGKSQDNSFDTIKRAVSDLRW